MYQEYRSVKALFTFAITKANIVLVEMVQPVRITEYLTVLSTLLLIGVLGTNLYLNIKRIRKAKYNELDNQN